MEIYEPPAAMIDWSAFTDCILSTRWSRPVDLRNELGLSQSTTMAAWHGRPIGVLPFVRICSRMGIDPRKFLVER